MKETIYHDIKYLPCKYEVVSSILGVAACVKTVSRKRGYLCMGGTHFKVA